MADNIYRNGGAADGDGQWPESGYGYGDEFDAPAKEHSPKMPPRNILESDSAKYTAEYIKEVVKGLYTVEPGSYPEKAAEAGYEASYEPKFGPKPDTGRINARRNAERQMEKRPDRPESPAEKAADIRPERMDSQRERRPEHKFESQPDERMDNPPETTQDMPSESEAEWRPEWKLEKRARRQESEGGPENVRRPDKQLDRRSERAAERERQAREYAAQPEGPQEESEFTQDSFLKAFEDKSRYEKIDYNPKRRERKTFSSLRADGNTGELTNALSGKSARRLRGERGGREPSPVAEEDSSAISPKPEDEYVYIKQAYAEPEAERVDSVIESAEQEKIPLIINKNIEARSRKTADDYRSIGKANYNTKPIKRFEPVEIKQRGVNVFAVLFMLIAIGIIGALVWKINSASVDDKAAQEDAEAVARLESQIRNLSQRNTELEEEVGRLTSLVETLERENQRLAELETPEVPPEKPDDTTQPADTAPSSGLQDGYYTVQSGDTLWKISEQFLGSGDEYLRIADANDLNPSEPLYAGLKLRIPGQ